MEGRGRRAAGFSQPRVLLEEEGVRAVFAEATVGIVDVAIAWLSSFGTADFWRPLMMRDFPAPLWPIKITFTLRIKGTQQK